MPVCWTATSCCGSARAMTLSMPRSATCRHLQASPRPVRGTWHSGWKARRGQLHVYRRYKPSLIVPIKGSRLPRKAFLQGLLERFLECRHPGWRVRVFNDLQMSKIERHVIEGLRDKNSVPPDGMGQTDFVEHVWIASGAVGDNDAGSVNRRPNIFQD